MSSGLQGALGLDSQDILAVENVSTSVDLVRLNQARSPLCRLHEDLLGCIMCDFLKPDIEQDTYGFDEPRSYLWLLPFISVSHRIRSVAVHYPRLWADIMIGFSSTIIGGLEWLDLCLTRSRSHDLHLTMRLAISAHLRESFVLITHHVPRVRSLGVRPSDPESAEYWEAVESIRFFQTFFNQPWSSLTHLTFFTYELRLMVMHRNEEETTVSDNMPDVVTLTALPQSLVQLTHLHISGDRRPWHLHSLPYVPNVRILRISRLDLSIADTQQRGTVACLPQLVRLDIGTCNFDQELDIYQIFYDLLLNTPDLEHFSIAHERSTQSRMFISGRSTLHLPRLRTVTLFGWAPFVSSFLVMLPDPHAALNVHVSLANWLAPTKLALAHVIARTSQFIRGAGDIAPSQVLHVLTFSHQSDDRACLSLAPISANITSSGRTLNFRCEEQLREEEAGSLIDVADWVKIQHVAELDMAFAAIATSSRAIQRLILVNWDRDWKSILVPDRLVSLEICLYDLVWKESPLQILEVDTSSQDDETLKKWLDEGLVGTVDFKPGLMT